MIEITGLVKRHGEVAALDGVSLTLAQDGVTAIIGPNGAGKSTLLSAVGRLARADSGTVVVGGLDIDRTHTRELARRMAVLRQDNHLPIRLTVGDLVAFGRFPHGGSGRTAADREHTDRALDLLDLTALRHRYLDELSGGQRQRAFVAMALAQDTDYLLLDEPLNNLDPRHAVSLMSLLRSLVDDRRMRIVVVLHDVNVAAHYADQVVAMRDGRVAAAGAVADVLTAGRLEALYDIPARVEFVAGRRVVLWA